MEPNTDNQLTRRCHTSSPSPTNKRKALKNGKPAANAPPVANFSSLSRELRDMVYHELLGGTFVHFRYDGIVLGAIYGLYPRKIAEQNKSSKLPAWLGTNKMMYLEGLEQFHSVAIFYPLTYYGMYPLRHLTSQDTLSLRRAKVVGLTDLALTTITTSEEYEKGQTCYKFDFKDVRGGMLVGIVSVLQAGPSALQELTMNFGFGYPFYSTGFFRQMVLQILRRIRILDRLPRGLRRVYFSLPLYSRQKPPGFIFEGHEGGVEHKEAAIQAELKRTAGCLVDEAGQVCLEWLGRRHDLEKEDRGPWEKVIYWNYEVVSGSYRRAKRIEDI